jgi:hypothetical protein
MRKLFILFFLMASATIGKTQLAIRNGESISPHGEFRVFIVFAEVDFSGGDCPCENAPDNLPNDWPKVNGVTPRL